MNKEDKFELAVFSFSLLVVVGVFVYVIAQMNWQ